MSRGAISSGAISASAEVFATPALVHAVTLLSGTDATSIIIGDGALGATEKYKLSNVGTTAAGDTTVSIVFNKPIICSTSVYATLAGTDAKAYVAYEPL